ncbi:unnamed protein product [Lactuca virosa]|uniref:Uncharacterized protein n=1 Tax=Lactuca virosa TaxID=75947 RepID=A0AAU9P435_9ASTR|nr:unnamed protein product [Lactuca virosa]
MASDSSDIPSLKNVEVVVGKVNPPKDVSKSTVDPNDSNSSDIPSPENFEDVCGKVDPLSDVSQSTFDPNDSSSSDICSPKKFGDFDGKVNPHSDLERVISEEISLIAKEEEKLSKKEKRKLALLCWKWEEVVDLCEDEDLGVDLPLIPVKKKVKVSIQSRNRVMKLFDESDVDE